LALASFGYLKPVRAELVEAPFFLSAAEKKNGPSTSSGRTGKVSIELADIKVR
jgi:hypothetical protein